MVAIQSPSSERLPASALLIELLEWVEARPRTYGQTMEAWRSSCPRMPVWEDALDGGLIQVVHSQGVVMNECAVKLTSLGQAVLRHHR
jgi:hypothetical protein